jgi:hypothetical protein
MKRSLPLIVCVALCSGPGFAQTTAKAPAGSTAECKDGSFSNAAKRADACKAHGGVKTWLGPAAAAVQTQSPAVTATEVAPTTAEPSRTPASPENPRGNVSPAPRTLQGGPK